MTFNSFSQFLEKLEVTGSRNEVTVMVADFLRLLDPVEARLAMYLMQGRLVPTFVPLEFNFSQKSALKALQGSFPEADATALFSKLGDVGLVAEKLVAQFGSAQDEIGNKQLVEVYEQLKQIAVAGGKGSQEQKAAIYVQLVRELDPLSARYASRVVIGSLRLGVSDKTVLDALSWYVTGDKSLREELERAYGARADIGDITEIVIGAKDLEGVEKQLSEIRLEVGTPVASKLVERESTPEAVWARMGECLVQPKLDGMRAQIHFDRAAGIAQVFSRNMESLTDSFPDLLAAVAELKVESAIIDSEVVGYDFESDSFLSYQETMQRRRKYDVGEMSEEIPVKAMTFDLLYLNGQDLSRQPVQDRLSNLQELIGSGDKRTLDLLETMQVSSEAGLSEYFFHQIGQGLEGIIIKGLGTTYDPGTRNFDWIKLKANSQKDMVDTVDVVVIGYYVGRGERAKFGIGSFLAAVYNPEDEKYYSVAKVGSGIKDEMWPEVQAQINKLNLESQPQNVVVTKSLWPDVWLTPKVVIEIEADEITRSPAHAAAADKAAKFEKDTAGRGLSLRFPRIKVWGRDKKPTQATTDTELLRMYELRKTP